MLKPFLFRITSLDSSNKIPMGGGDLLLQGKTCHDIRFRDKQQRHEPSMRNRRRSKKHLRNQYDAFDDEQTAGYL